jgi:hypothetical protein
MAVVSDNTREIGRVIRNLQSEETHGRDRNIIILNAQDQRKLCPVRVSQLLSTGGLNGSFIFLYAISTPNFYDLKGMEMISVKIVCAVMLAVTSTAWLWADVNSRPSPDT